MSGQFIDAPAPKFIDAPAPTSTPPAVGGFDLGGIAKKVGDVAGGVYRNVNAARTAAARDPVGALGNIGGALQGAVAGGMMGPVLDQRAGKENPNDLGSSLQSLGRGVWSGMTDPSARARYNEAGAAMLPRPKGDSMPARIGRGVEDFGLQTATDPFTYAGAPIVKGIGSLLSRGAGLVHDIPAVAKYANDVRAAVTDPRLKPAIGKVSNAVRTLTAPIRGGVNAGKDMLFLNPLPHGLGNMTTNNFLANGIGTAAKGLKYGITGAPKGSVAALDAMKAGAWTPELLGDPSPWGPVGWMNALGKKGVPAAVRGGVGAVAGGGVANQTAPEGTTPGQRLTRDAEGAILGGLTGASPEALNLSNKVMSRLETGHRAAMLEDMPQAVAAAVKKPHFTAAEVARALKKQKPPEVHGPATMNTNAFAIQPNAPSRIHTWPGAGIPKEKPPDPRADAINAVFGGLDKSPTARIASALGGPFAQWQADTVPRVVGGALKNAPARVEALARGQQITNNDVLKDKPYKLQVGGPVGGAAEMAFNTPKYASRLLGPLGNVDPNQATKPDTFDAGEQLKNLAYSGTPGREVVGPFFGDTMFPSKAPAVPNAALGTALGWHFSNKTPATDAILQIMRSGPFTQEQAARLYERYKR